MPIDCKHNGLRSLMPFWPRAAAASRMQRLQSGYSTVACVDQPSGEWLFGRTLTLHHAKCGAQRCVALPAAELRAPGSTPCHRCTVVEARSLRASKL